MVFKFRLISNEIKGFQRDIEILSDQSFYKLHCILTKSFHYDDSQLASFFTTDKQWNRLHEITLFDFSEGKSEDINLMDECILKDFISTKGEHLLYVFDYFNGRYMTLELIRIQEEDSRKTYPLISHAKLSPPPQLLIIDTNFDDSDFDE
ncbi:MAG: hypothetical protein K9H49_16385 [Bacteroidales bacterium]|nr:hypothetical protein [Bacteroidales bacterium]MCF8390569.1 hypothetical protein [Bacteroidales bacterium]